jgi:hypothetical protein
MSNPPTATSLLRRIRICLGVFVLGLIISGITAIPLETELKCVVGLTWQHESSSLSQWLLKVRDGLIATNAKYPFIAYGTDWLAFAHFVIAIVFIGPFRDPVRNIWVIEFGIIACVLVVPFALAAGSFRGIPFGWRLIDCSFGAIGIIPLLICRTQTNKLARLSESG